MFVKSKPVLQVSTDSIVTESFSSCSKAPRPSAASASAEKRTARRGGSRAPHYSDVGNPEKRFSQSTARSGSKLFACWDENAPKRATSGSLALLSCLLLLVGMRTHEAGLQLACLKRMQT